MAGTRTRYVNAASAGGDGTTQDLAGGSAAYASLSTALAGEVDDLPTADVVLEIICEGSTADTTSVAHNDSWVTDATRYVIIKPGASDVHPGYWDTGKYRFSGTTHAADTFQITSIDHLIIEGLQIERANGFGGAAAEVIEFLSGFDAGWVKVRDCIIRLNHTDGSDAVDGIIGLKDSSPTYYFSNNMIGIASTSQHDSVGSLIKVNQGGVTIHLHNNTFKGVATVGIDCGDSTWHLKNNIVDGATTCISGTPTTERYNSTSDGTGTGTGSRDTQSFTYEGADDWRITSGDAGAKDFGEDLSGDGSLAITDDIVGTDRTSGTYDIGAFEVVGAGDPVAPLAAAYNQMLRGGA